MHFSARDEDEPVIDLDFPIALDEESAEAWDRDLQRFTLLVVTLAAAGIVVITVLARMVVS
jgi:hypothetical protein